MSLCRFVVCSCLILLAFYAPAQTCDRVRVQFVGCADAKLPDPIDARIGKEQISLKLSAGFYEGTTKGPFSPTDPARMLRVDVPGVRTACDIPGQLDSDPLGLTCRAFYTVQCDAQWSLAVTAKAKVPSFAYTCEHNAIHACDGDGDDSPVELDLDPDLPLTIAPLTHGQGVTLGVETDDGDELQFDVKHKLLVDKGGTVRLSQLQPRRSVSHSAETPNPYLANLKRLQADLLANIVLKVNP